MGARGRSTLLGVAIAVALADSSVVTLALPDVLRRYDVSITTVAWVLTAFNLALALAAVPAARLAHRAPRAVFAAGVAVFAGASLACGVAPSFAALVAARAVQAAGAAGLVAAALSLLAACEGSQERAAHVWARAGVLGAALGPAAGGLLTQLLGWESIFLVQAPLLPATLAALPRLRVSRPVAVPSGRPHRAANAALLLASAALSAALFLLVVLLVDGWSLDPAAAGLVATAMPVAALAAARVARREQGAGASAAAGLVLVAGGLAALGLLPHAGWTWTLAPQALVGCGLGLTVAALTRQALRGRSPLAVHGGWTIASRHAGVVLGLLLLTPLFAAQLDRNETEAKRAGTAILLDSRIAPLDKLRLAQDVLRRVERADGRLPDVRPAFAGRDDPEARRVAGALQDQLERAVTSAFGPPFLLAAGLAALALVAVALGRREAGL
ncbi:MAG TPA: MFS transporter [Gaiellaceae bacterium]|nr:MFS transporter [Gaiellaceae bacterium]